MSCLLLVFSLDKSPKKNDFEIHKKEDSVQKKRQYRSNKDESSGSDSDDDKRAAKVRHGIIINLLISFINCSSVGEYIVS